LINTNIFNGLSAYIFLFVFIFVLVLILLLRYQYSKVPPENERRLWFLDDFIGFI